MDTIKVLKKSIRDYKLPSILTPIFIIGEVVLETLIPTVMAVLIDEISKSISMDPIIKYGLILLAMALASLLCGFIAGKFAATASCGYARNLRHDMYYKIQDFSFAEIDRFSTSSLVTRLTTDVTNVQNAYQMIIRIAIRTPLMLIFAFVFSFRINWRIALIFLAAMPVLMLALALMMKFVMPFFRKIFRKYDDMNESVQENVQAIRVVKSFVREDYEKGKFEKVSSEVRNDFTKAERIMALAWPIMMLCIFTVIAVIMFLGAKTIITSHGEELTVGNLSALINYAIMALMSMMMLSMVIVMLTMSVESANRIKEVLVTESSLKSPENGITTDPALVRRERRQASCRRQRRQGLRPGRASRFGIHGAAKERVVFRHDKRKHPLGQRRRVGRRNQTRMSSCLRRRIYRVVPRRLRYAYRAGRHERFGRTETKTLYRARTHQKTENPYS